MRPPPDDNRERIGRWLARRIGERTGLATADIGWDRPFTELGLASLDMVALAVELGVWLGCEVETTLLFNQPDIAHVVQALAEAPAGEGAEAARPLARQEPLAIVGLACRFPGAPDATAFWRLLQEGGEAISDVPAWRWGPETFEPGDPKPGKAYVRRAGFVDGIDRFDPAFFGISAREARVMDPQHRLVLMTAWHALEDAGIPPARLAGTRTGVFVGIGASDYFGIMEQANIERDAYFGTGIAAAIASNRLSYLLDLRGPSLSIDTTCSSSLVALHQARASLLAGESDAAIVAGVNVIVCAGGMVTMSQSRMLSPTARCHTFDEAADGYVRGEGCGVVVLKRFSDALRDGDRIHALVAGSAVNQDGRSAGLTVPNGEAQVRLMRDALAAAGLAPGRIGLLEAHGTGTPLGDPIEVGAVRQVYGAPSEEEPVLRMGSVKTNIGHLEAAAGIAGLIKVVLAMAHQEVPPHRNFARLNPRIRLDGTRLQVASEAAGWPMSLRPRYAAVSSFGIGGTNAHAVMQDAPATALLVAPADPAPAEQLFVLSAKDPDTLREQARRHAQHLHALAPPGWEAACHTALARRAHLPHRLALVAANPAEAAQRLVEWAQQGHAPGVHDGLAPARREGGLAFLFTGQGAQYAGMGAALYGAHAGFMQALQQCDAVLASLGEPSVIERLYPAHGEPCDLARTEDAQPALFVLEYALAQVWLQAGFRPDALLGHSLGEYVAACIAGVFSLEDALALVTTRARLMQHSTPPGAMAAVQAPAELIGGLLAQCPPLAEQGLAVAARNTPEEIVLSGEPQALGALLARWREAGATVTPLHVARAFHSPLMAGMVEAFTERARAVTYHPPQWPLLSNLSGGVAGEEVACADYWVRHTLAPVAFAECAATLDGLGIRWLVEIGPHPVLGGCVRRMQPHAKVLPSMSRGSDAMRSLLDAWAAWHVAGGALDPDAAWRHRTAQAALPPVASLPPYAFRADRHWFADEHAAPPAAHAGAPSAPAHDPLAAALRAQPLTEHDEPRIEDYLFRCIARALRMGAQEQAALRAGFGAATLPEAGIDSLMAVELREAVRRDLGLDLPTRVLLDGRPVSSLVRHVREALAQAAGPAGEALPSLAHDAAARHEAFALGALGRAMWQAAQSATPVEPNDLYCEVDFDDDDVGAMEAAWNVLVQRHDMLRAEVGEGAMLRVLPHVPHYRIEVDDLAGEPALRQHMLLAQRREALSQAVLRTDRWPLFDLRATRLGAGRVRLHMRFSVLLVDTQSLAVLGAEWRLLGAGPQALPAPPAVTYRDYRLAVHAMEASSHPHFVRARDHWLAQHGALPPAPELPVTVPCTGAPARHASLRAHMAADAWRSLKRRLAAASLTPSAALLTLYVDVLRGWARRPAFSLGVVASQRLDLHPDVQRIVGDFAELSVLAVPQALPDDFEPRARLLQARLLDALDHLRFSAIGLVEGGVAPFLFNSMLHMTGEGEAAGRPAMVGRVAYTLTRGAGTRCEMQLTEEDDGALLLNWDVRLDTFAPGEPEQRFAQLVERLHALAEACAAREAGAAVEEVQP